MCKINITKIVFLICKWQSALCFYCKYAASCFSVLSDFILDDLLFLSKHNPYSHIYSDVDESLPMSPFISLKSLSNSLLFQNTTHIEYLFYFTKVHYEASDKITEKNWKLKLDNPTTFSMSRKKPVNTKFGEGIFNVKKKDKNQ